MLGTFATGVTLDEAKKEKQDVLDKVKRVPAPPGYTVNMDRSDTQWGPHTAVCASVGVSYNILIVSFEYVCKPCSCAFVLSLKYFNVYASSASVSMSHRQQHCLVRVIIRNRRKRPDSAA